MEDITIKGEFLFELANKQQWINQLPSRLPEKKYSKDEFLFVDKNGHIFQKGADFTEAEKADTYPCKVYRIIPVRAAYKKS